MFKIMLLFIIGIVSMVSTMGENYGVATLSGAVSAVLLINILSTIF